MCSGDGNSVESREATRCRSVVLEAIAEVHRERNNFVGFESDKSDAYLRADGAIRALQWVLERL